MILTNSARAGISVSNTPGAVDDATATTALYLVISTQRQFSLGERSLRAGSWKGLTSAAKAHDLADRTLGILGLGGIGLRLAHLVHAFPMRVVYHSRHPNPDAPAWCEYYENVEEMLEVTDVLSVHVPLRADTEGLVGEKMIRGLKRGSVIVNTARGKVIDEEAMIRALEDGHVSGPYRSYLLVTDKFGFDLAAGLSRPRRVPRRTERQSAPAPIPSKHAPPTYGHGEPRLSAQDGGPGTHEPQGLPHKGQRERFDTGDEVSGWPVVMAGGAGTKLFGICI